MDSYSCYICQNGLQNIQRFEELRNKVCDSISDPNSGRKLEVYNDQPGIQIYTGSHFDTSETGKLGAPIQKWAGVAMETQIFPDSPNHEHFPNAILRPGETYKHTCV